MITWMIEAVVIGNIWGIFVNALMYRPYSIAVILIHIFVCIEIPLLK
jgi:hypothetical protein